MQAMTPALAARLAARERPSGISVLSMRWEGLLFLHWAWDAAEIQKSLPAGLHVDTHEGQAWLGVVPFFMRRVHPRLLPCVPWLSDFLELNVRTYAFDDRGVPGVWFYSLLCNQPVAVELARRFFHLNYLHARLHASGEFGNTADFTWLEPGQAAATFRGRETGAYAPAAPGGLEFFLVERYVLYSADPRGKIHAGSVHHRPYEIAPAAPSAWSFRPAASLGFADPARPPDHALLARPVQVDAWPIRRVSGD
jgi:uncharacterized protein YqjF (DUF2071 family)